MPYKLILLFVFWATAVSAQNFPGNNSGSPKNRVAKATEFSIPSSPAFNLLNENTPSRIERYASLHDFKVDWSLTNGQQGYTLSPGLAIEAQPVWLLCFDRGGAQKYRNASPLLRTLSTLSLSIGTNSSNEKNWLAYAAKLSLYRQHDPLNDAKFLRTLEQATDGPKDSLLLKIKVLEMQQIRLSRRDENYSQRYEMLADSIMELEFDISELEREQSQKLTEVRDNYIQEHWNSSYLDIAFGRLLTYEQTTSVITKTIESLAVPGEMDTVSFNNNTLKVTNTGFGIWASGGIGLGDHALLSGMARYGKKPSKLTGTIGQVFSTGASLRYGARRYNFFIEAFYDHSFAPLASSPETKMEQKFYMLTIGGDWRVSRNVMLSFGIRQTKDFDNGTYLLQPLINVNCLMR
ncbi:MAG: hypothetical protein H6559_29830 [Lewinellaceae bacterium]|nr:hypothetical protein [Lewinellaceae bacterium]